MMPITDSIKFYGPLHDDVEQCLVGIDIGEDIDYWKRSYLRCLCTFVEARVHLLKMELNAVDHLIENPDFPPELKGYLSGKEWIVGNNGEVKSKNKVLSPVVELKTVIKILGSVYPDLLWDFGSHRWTRVKSLYKARNGLVHPKCPNDLLISIKEIQEFEVFRTDFLEWSAAIYREAWGVPADAS